MGLFSKNDYDAYSTGGGLFGNQPTGQSDMAQWQAAFDGGQAIRLAAAQAGRPLTAAEKAQVAAFDKTATTLEAKINQDPAARLDIREFRREGDVKLGGANIDTAFKGFGPDYFNKFVDDYRKVYDPQLSQQYSRAQGKMSAQLAERGIGESTVAAHGMADLLRQNNTAKTQIASEANDTASKLKNNVQTAKQNLHSLNLSAADPAAASAQAQAQATTLIAPPTFSTLGDVFSAALQPFMAYQRANGNRSGPRYTSPYGGNPGGSGSGSVIN